MVLVGTALQEVSFVYYNILYTHTLHIPLITCITVCAYPIHTSYNILYITSLQLPLPRSVLSHSTHMNYTWSVSLSEACTLCIARVLVHAVLNLYIC